MLSTSPLHQRSFIHIAERRLTILCAAGSRWAPWMSKATRPIFILYFYSRLSQQSTAVLLILPMSDINLAYGLEENRETPPRWRRRNKGDGSQSCPFDLHIATPRLTPVTPTSVSSDIYAAALLTDSLALKAVRLWLQGEDLSSEPSEIASIFGGSKDGTRLSRLLFAQTSPPETLS